MVLIYAAIIIAVAILYAAHLWRHTMAVSPDAIPIVQQYVDAQTAYDAKIAAAAATAVAPVQAALDAAKASVTTLTQTLADTNAAFKAQADKMTADSGHTA